MAHENFLTAGRAAGAARIIWAFNPDLADVRVEQKSGNRAGGVHGPLERLIQFAARHIVGGKKRHADGVQARFHRDAFGGAAHAGGGGNFFIPIEQLHPLTIDRDFEFLALHAAQNCLEVTGNAFHLERILAVGRELIFNQDAAARPERQPHDVVILRRIGGHFEDGLGWRRHIADGQTADFSRRREIRFHQRRGQRERAGDVVKTVCRIVGRQEFCGVHLEPQHVTNRIRIFSAVQAVHTGRDQIGGGVAVQFLLHESDHGFHHRRTRTRHARGRHHSSAQLADHFFADLGMLRQLGEVQLIQHQPRRFQTLIVTDDAILIDQCALGSG